MITNQSVKTNSKDTLRTNRAKKSASPAVRQLVRHQARLRHRERLSAIGEMASTLVHEIRNPLAVIGGFAREMIAEDSSDQEQSLPLKIIVSEVSRLESLVENVLGFARTARSRARLCDINEALRENCDRLEALCRQSAIEVRLDLAEGLPGVLLDRSQFNQVLDNLCANARAAMPRGGTITVASRQAGGEVEVRISDNGPGIPVAQQSRVFEPFFSLSTNGTGLGLAVASKIIAGHGGAIRLDSGTESGAAFLLRFPVPTSKSEA
jgi:two-component system sensor histidine kinase HydH